MLDRRGGPKNISKERVIVALYKNKGDRSDCNNHRGISLKSIVGSGPLATAEDCRQGTKYHSVDSELTDTSRHMILSLKQLKEKYREQH